jgi:hypothetical protein
VTANAVLFGSSECCITHHRLASLCEFPLSGQTGGALWPEETASTIADIRAPRVK